MPIQLTTPFNPGDLDPTTYQQAKIVAYTVGITGQEMTVHSEYGNTVGGVWQVGSAAPPKLTNISGQDFLDLVLQEPAPGDTIYEAVSKALYEYLLDKGVYIGTIV